MFLVTFAGEDPEAVLFNLHNRREPDPDAITVTHAAPDTVTATVPSALLENEVKEARFRSRFSTGEPRRCLAPSPRTCRRSSTRVARRSSRFESR